MQLDLDYIDIQSKVDTRYILCNIQLQKCNSTKRSYKEEHFDTFDTIPLFCITVVFQCLWFDPISLQHFWRQKKNATEIITCKLSGIQNTDPLLCYC